MFTHSLDANARAVFISAAYFKLSWDQPFPGFYKTSHNGFYVTPTEAVQVCEISATMALKY